VNWLEVTGVPGADTHELFRQTIGVRGRCGIVGVSEYRLGAMGERNRFSSVAQRTWRDRS
jgi:hypothetical protein